MKVSLKLQVPFKLQIVLAVLFTAVFSEAFTLFSLTRVDNIVHDELYAYGLRFSYKWAEPYWTNIRLTMAFLAFSIASIIVAVALILLPMRKGETASKSVSCGFLAVGAALTLFSAYLFSCLDHQITYELYQYGLRFSVEWVEDYRAYATQILGLIGFSTVATFAPLSVFLAGLRGKLRAESAKLLSLKITRRTLKKIAIVSCAVAIALFVVSVFFYGFSPDFDYLLVVVFAVGVAPSGAASVIHNRWRNKMEKAMPEFLRDLATSIRTGVPIQAALEHASKRMYGPLTSELKLLVAHMSWGMTFEEALNKLSERVDLPLIKKATVLIVEAGRHGGDLSNIFEFTAKYIENVNAWTLKRRMQTMPYVAIFYFSVVLFLFIIILISRMIFVPISELSAGGVPLIKPIVTPENARRVFLHTSLLESFFGGLLAGKINEDSFFGGLKHACVLAIVSGLAFFFFFR